jgi:hypothetical protein
MLKPLMKSNNDNLKFPWASVLIQALAAGWFIFCAIFRDKLDTMEEFHAGMSYLLGVCIGLSGLGLILICASKLVRRIEVLEEKLNKLKRPEE